MTPNMTAGKEGGIASRSSPISILIVLLEKGKKVEQRTGQESHKQQTNCLAQRKYNLSSGVKNAGKD